MNPVEHTCHQYVQPYTTLHRCSSCCPNGTMPMLLRLDSFISWLVQTKGPDLYRSKGVWRPSGSDDSVNLVLGSFLPTAAKHRRLHRTAKSKATPTTKVLAVHGMPQKFVFHAVHMQQLSSRSAVWNSRWILDLVRFLYRGMTQADLANKVPINFERIGIATHCAALASSFLICKLLTTSLLAKPKWRNP